jgi:PAS domain S-box-containing protein
LTVVKPRVILRPMRTQVSEPSLTDPERLAALRRYGSVRQDAGSTFARVAKLAARGLNARGALICWVGEASLRFAGAYGLELNDLLPRTLPKRLSLFLPEGLVQSRDPSDLQAISSLLSSSIERLSFFASSPLRTSTGQVLGCLCVLDTRERSLNESEVIMLEGLSESLMGELDLRLELVQAKETPREMMDALNRSILERVVNSTDEAIVTENLQGIVTSWNVGAEKMFGYTTAEAVGQHISFLIPRANNTSVQGFIQRMMLGEKIPPFETQRVHKSGFRVNVRVSMSPILDTNNAVVGVVSITGAPSEMKGMRSEARLWELTSNLPIFVLGTDMRGSITLAEGRALDLLGFESRNLVGRAIQDVFEGQPQMLEAVQAATRGEGLSFSFEWHGRHFETWLTPVLDGDKRTGLRAIAFDITDRINAQTALNTSDMQLREIIGALPVRVARIDVNGIISLYEGRDVRPQTSLERVGRSAFEVFGSSQVVVAGLKRALAGESFTAVIEWEGAYRECWVSPIVNNESQITGATAIIVDVSEEFRSREALARTQAELSKITSSLPILMVKTDMQGSITYFGGGALAILQQMGVPPEHHQIVGQSIIAEFQTRPSVLAAIARALKGETFDEVLEWNGRYFETWVSPIMENGVMIGASCIAADVTDRQLAEDQAKAAQTELKTLLSSLPVLIFKLDRVGRVSFFEGRGLEDFGIEAAQIVGRSFFDTYHEFPEMLEIGRRAMAGESFSAITFWQSHHLEIRVSPILEHDRKVGTSLIAVDVTDRTLAESRLKARESQLSSIIAAMPVLFIGYDQAGIVTLLEGRDVTPEVSQKSLGRPVQEFGFLGADERLSAVLAGESLHYNLERDGRYIEVFISPVMQNGIVMGGRGLAVDVSDRIRALKDLETTQERLEYLIDQLPIILIACDQDGKLTRIEGEAIDILSANPDQMLGMSLETIFQKNSEAMAVVKRALNGETFDANVQWGKYYARVSVSALFDGGVYQGTTAVITNQTSEKLIQQELQATVEKLLEAEQQLKAEQDYALLITQVVDQGLSVTNSEGFIEYSNPAAAKILGFAHPEELIGRKPTDFIVPDDLEIHIQESVTRRSGVASAYRNRVRRTDGKIVEVLASGFPRIVNGEFRGTVGVLTLLTEQKLQELELQTTTAQLEQTREALELERDYALSVTNIVSQGLAITNNDGLYEYVNPAFAKILGYGVEEFIGKNSIDLVVPEEHDLIRMARAQRKRNISTNLRNTMIKKDGSRIEVAVTGIPRKIAGIVIGTVLVLTDLSEQNRREIELRESEARYRSLLAISQQQTRELELLEQIRNALSRELDPINVVKTIVELTSKLFHYPLVSIYLLEGTELVLQHSVGYSQVIERLDIKRGIMGKVARTGKAILVENASTDPDFIGAFEGLSSEVCVPLFDENLVVGVLNIETIDDLTLNNHDLRVIGALADRVSNAIVRAKRFTQARDAENQYKNILEGIEEVIFQTDEHAKLRFLSPAWHKITGFEIEEALGQAFITLIHPSDSEQLRTLLEGLLQGDSDSLWCKARYFKKDVSIGLVEITAWPIKNTRGRITGLTGTLQEIGERQQLST